MEGSPPDPELSGFLDQGDLRAAGTWLVDRYACDVIGLCRTMVRPNDVAEDIVQDTFGAAFAALSSFRRDASARTWLLSIARNRCIDHLRRERRAPFADWKHDETADDHVHPGPLPSDVVLTRDDVTAALERLDEGARALVVLRFRHGLDYPELSEVFGVKEGTVRMRLSRALSRMRRALENRDVLVTEEPHARATLRQPALVRAPIPPRPPRPPRAPPASDVCADRHDIYVRFDAAPAPDWPSHLYGWLRSGSDETETTLHDAPLGLDDEPTFELRARLTELTNSLPDAEHPA